MKKKDLGLNYACNFVTIFLPELIGKTTEFEYELKNTSIIMYNTVLITESMFVAKKNKISAT